VKANRRSPKSCLAPRRLVFLAIGISAYFAGAVAGVFWVDFTLEEAECFFMDFFVPLAAVGAVAEEVEAGAFAGAAVCAKSETPASAIVIVSPMIVFFIVVILWEALVFFASVLIDDAIMNRP